MPTVMITTDAFNGFGRLQARIKGCPHIATAETPNPIRNLDRASLRQRAEQMLETIVWGLTASPEEIVRRRS
ncbi:MAG: hypothetical protein HYY45_06195 [Deltaproteobacteria bacterium]|nr:hypothetical protein [Deltaproteobacteria bacterium]